MKRFGKHLRIYSYVACPSIFIGILVLLSVMLGRIRLDGILVGVICLFVLAVHPAYFASRVCCSACNRAFSWHVMAAFPVVAAVELAAFLLQMFADSGKSDQTLADEENRRRSGVEPRDGVDFTYDVTERTDSLSKWVMRCSHCGGSLSP